MKSSKGIVFKRQQKILSLLKSNEFINVADIAKELNVSPLTVRRDLDVFQERGIVERIYGGARFIKGKLNEDPTFSHKETELNKLSQIAKAAADMIEENDTVFINSSSTALKVLNYLGDKSVTIVTNNANAISLPKKPNITLILSGGEIYERKNSMIGNFALNVFTKINANKCILGVSGINELGITTSVLQETAINRIMLERTIGRRIILATGDRVGKEHNFLSCEIPLVTDLVTDKTAPEDELMKLTQKKIKITIVEDGNDDEV